MPDPTRPVDAAEIETAWGQAVHDATFAPKGCHATSTSPRVCGTTNLIIPLDVAADDPGGWIGLASDHVTAPTGAAGLYLVHARLNTVNGTAGESTRAFVYLNSAQYDGASASNDGSTNVKFAVDTIVELSATDVLDIRASKTGGANVDVTLYDLWVVRIGSELGA